MAIFFFNEDIDFRLSDETATVKWINSILVAQDLVEENINYIFCSDKYLHEVNLQYLNHDTLTDIITFDHSEDEKRIEADIFVSVERIRENASRLNKSFEEELHRVIIHGILHIIGYSDKSDTEKQTMREKEDACLSLR